MRTCGLIIALGLGFHAMAWAPVAVPPALPAAAYNTRADIGEPSAAAIAGYTQVSVPDTGNPATNAANLQTAVTNAACGTVILLPGGVRYEPAGGTITLPAKGCAAGQWVVIMSSASPSSLPGAGVRVTPADAGNLPVIVEGVVNASALQVAAGANNYLIELLEFTVDTTALSGADSSGSMIAAGDGTYGAGCTVCNVAQQPVNIIVDRALIRGSDSPPVGFRRGVSLACTRCAVINSYIDQMHEIGADAQAIAGWNSTGPWLIDNNYLEGAAENILFGGAPSNMTQPISDVVITHNYFYKPLSWDEGSPDFVPISGEPAGTTWSIKNLLEFKTGVRVLVEGNTFQNSWPSGQEGRAVALTVTTGGSDNDNPWLTVSDVTVAYNHADATWGFIEVAGAEYIGHATQPQRVSIHDNLATNQGDAPPDASGGGPGQSVAYFIQGLSDYDARYAGLAGNVLIDHNTLLVDVSTPVPVSSGMQFESIVAAAQSPLPNWIMKDNIFEAGNGGIAANCTVGGGAANCYTAAAWLKNFVYGTSLTMPGNWNGCNDGPYTIYEPNGIACPVANVAAVGFVDAAGGNFALALTSPGHNAATDGSDVGANITRLNQALAGALPCPTGSGSGSNIRALAFDSGSGKMLSIGGTVNSVAVCAWGAL